MEIDSKPEAMDRLERRIIQLKIEREALKKETDEASKKRLARARRADQDARKGVLGSRRSVEGREGLGAERRAHQGGARARARSSSKRRAARRTSRACRSSRTARFRSSSAGSPRPAAPSSRPTKLLRNKVTEEEVAEVVSKWTGIPVSKMLEGEREKLLRMEEALRASASSARTKPCSAVSDAIRRSRAGLSDPNRPNGSFLFLGPTGVGKTELCKALAEFLFDTEEAMVRIDMSEFMEKHSVARLIGAPPGYVGYEEGGYLTEAVRRRPYSVLLLDEVEKAHPDVFNVLLQVLDDGRLTDGQGRTVDFRNTVIIMTSNLGSHVIQELAGEANYAKMKQAVMEIVQQHFRPEFINRVDDIVVFHPLGREQLRAIVDIQLGYLRRRLAERDIELALDDAARDLLGEAGFDPVYGARPLKRAIQQQVENPLAQRILQGRVRAGQPRCKVDGARAARWSSARASRQRSRFDGWPVGLYRCRRPAFCCAGNAPCPSTNTNARTASSTSRLYRRSPTRR